MHAKLKRKVDLGLLAKDLAAVRVSSSDRARGHLVERLGKLHGLPQKIGQILSLNELEEEAGLYTTLTESPAALAPAAAFAAMEAELGRPLGECFREIRPEGIAASLSQVHRAELHDGRVVAVKVQYPGIDEAVWHDLKALGWLTAPVGGLRRGFNLAAYQDEIRSILEEELSYRLEANMLARMGRHTASMKGVCVPEVVPELSTNKVLTMTWMDGAPLSEVRQWPEDQRRSIAESFLHVFMVSCFRWRLLHGDPHPGNFRFQATSPRPTIVLLDFGCVKAVSTETAEAMRWLVQATIDGALEDDRDGVIARYLDIGFDEEMLTPIMERLPALTEALFLPFRSDGAFDVASWQMSERVTAVLGEDRWNFRFAGPADLLVFIRAYQGLLQYLKALGVALDWREMFYRSVPRSPVVRKPPGPRPGPAAPSAQARSLRVRVTKSGKTKVALTFRAEAAARLDELMPEDVLEHLNEGDIDIIKLQDETVRSGFTPGELFSLDNGEKSIRVWLE